MGNVAGLITVIILQASSQVGGQSTGTNIEPGTGQIGVTGANTSGTAVPTGDVRMEPTGDKNFDTPPVWIKAPEPRAVGTVYPTEALRTGKSGTAQVKCTLTVEGALTSCRIASETPAGAGFGAATLVLAPDLDITPASKAGKPVATQINLNVSYNAPPPTIGSYIAGTDVSAMQHVLTNAPWQQAPSYSDVVAAYPPEAKAANKSGRVSLDCTLGDDGHFESCQVANEQPVGYKFGSAALDLSKTFKMSTTLPDGKTAVAGASYKLPFTFSTRMLQSGNLVTGEPVLVAIPSNQDLSAAFPKAARAAGIAKAQVAMDCTIGAGGSLTRCGVVSESPAGYGFAAGALQLASKYRVSEWSPDGLPTIGGKVRVPVSYNLTVR